MTTPWQASELVRSRPGRRRSRWRRGSAVLALGAAAAVTALALSAAAGASAKQTRPHLLVGLYDEGETLFDPPDYTFPLYRALRTQVLRVGLHWGGPAALAVARRKPAHPANPDDPAYDWSLYDRTVQYASSEGIRVLFSIVDTPRWANRGQPANHAPTNFTWLRDFARAAAIRYSGAHEGYDGRTLPAVHYWTAWNEPNNPVFLSPQYVRKGGKWVVQSAIDYAKICNAIYTGVHAVRGEKVACGETAPRGNNQPNSVRPSVSPVAFLLAAYKAGMRHLDAYAHHPYYGSPSEGPTTAPPTKRGASPTAVTLANIGTLLATVKRFYGSKHLWITEYGYQTNPPDRQFGVSYAKQSAYMKQAYALARKNPRIDMMLWYLAKDQPNISGWQSGLTTATTHARKPAFDTFRKLPRG